MTGTTYDGHLGLVVRGLRWKRTHRPPLSLTVLERSDHLLVLPSDQSGGARGGDRHVTEVDLDQGAAVEWRPPSSSLFFPAAHDQQACIVETQMRLGAGSRLVWVPPVSIPCRGAQIEQSVEIVGEPGAGLFFWDSWTDGRIASGERGAFASLKNDLSVRWSGRTIFRERWQWQGGPARNADPAGFQGACQWHLGLAAGLDGLARLRARVEAWQAVGENAEWGELDDGLWVARALVQYPRASPSPKRLDQEAG